MKIILYTYDIMKIGGIETSFFLLSNYLKEKGYDVSVRYSTGDPMRVKRYKDAGIDIKPMEKETCDILIVGSIYRIPTLISAKVTAQQVHADWSDDFWKNSPVAIKMLQTANSTADIFLPVSKSSAKFVAKYVDKPILVMNNLAPEKTKLKRVTHDKLVIASFTRMSTEKGLKNYEKLRDKLRALKIDAELRVYTTGEAPSGWNKHEPVPDIRTELTDVDFVASLADTESFGYTIAEANSCGIPCIIKLTNGTKEFFDDVSNIILDDVDNLTKKQLTTKRKVTYNLPSVTKQSIDETMKELKRLASKKCIIRSVKMFKDLQDKRIRKPGEVFAVSNKRAKELLNSKLNIAEKL